MSAETCFVVMAIGDQEFEGQTITAASLKSKYADLIKEAILKARPGLDVTRADDISLPGTITTDIISRIMHSHYVVADVTYPNPNVYYELGLRHACRTGTIIIRDREGPRVPFDISHLRYVEYDNTPAGLKALASRLGEYFAHFERDSTRPDNQFQEFAKLTNYEFPDYRKAEEVPPEMQAIMSLIESPEIMSMILRQQAGEPIDEGALLSAVMSNPKIAQPLVQAMVKSGSLAIPGLTPPPTPAPASKRITKRR